MAMPLTTDIAIIGAGTAGLTAFHEIARSGRSVVLIDHGPLGTTCARVGCMPSKAALHAGQRWANLQDLLRGTPTAAGAATADSLWRHARETRDLLAAGAAQRTVTAAGDRLLMGTARFTGPQTLDVDGRHVRAQAFIIATGSRPVVPAALEALGTSVLTTDTLFDLDALPGRIGIVGLGAIGLEMGLALARLGVRVVAGDLSRSVAGIRDPAVNARAVERFGSELTMWLGQPVEVQREGAAIALRSGCESQVVDRVLAALGRRPNVEALDLAQAGVAVDAQGRPAVDPFTLRAADLSIFLAGDAAADRPLMHEAADEGLIAAQGALRLIDGQAPLAQSRRTPLSIVFSDPDIAAVGERLDQLAPDDTVVGSAEGAGNGRSRILGAEGNLVRLYADRETGVLRGASLIANQGEHLAHLLAWAIQRGETIDGLLAMPYYHPSIEEMVQSALKDAARQRHGRS
jgi:dihydrolipoamide dehydrogenase